jgi:hypothetical protein
MSIPLWYFIIGFITGTIMFVGSWVKNERSADCAMWFLTGLLVWWIIWVMGIFIYSDMAFTRFFDRMDKWRGLR